MLAEGILEGPVSADLLRLLAARAEGNPFFAEQILRYLMEDGLLQLDQDGWAVTEDCRLARSCLRAARRVRAIQGLRENSGLDGGAVLKTEVIDSMHDLIGKAKIMEPHLLFDRRNLKNRGIPPLIDDRIDGRPHEVFSLARRNRGRLVS